MKEFVAIHSVPRSGSSWLGEIINSSPNVNYKFQPLFSYAYKARLDVNSSRQEVDSFFCEISQSDDEFINQIDSRRKGHKPNFKKSEITHIAYKEVRYHYILEHLIQISNKVKIVLLIRNPFAVLNSFKNSPREFRNDLGWQFENEWQFAKSKNENRREEYFGYEKWKEAALLFLKLKYIYPDRVYLIDYNALLIDKKQEVYRLYDFLSLDINEQTRNFITPHEQTNDDTYSVIKNIESDSEWKSNLSPLIINYIQKDLEGTVLQKYLTSF